MFSNLVRVGLDCSVGATVLMVSGYSDMSCSLFRLTDGAPVLVKLFCGIPKVCRIYTGERFYEVCGTLVEVLLLALLGGVV